METFQDPHTPIASPAPIAKEGVRAADKPNPENEKNDSTSSDTTTADLQNSEEIPTADEANYPTKLKLILIVFSLNISLFCVGLDNTILSSAIPKITDQFHALDDVGWYASSYLLTTCAFQLTWGKIYAFYPAKWTYLAALFIFELGSLIAGVAPSSTALIIGRAISGIGAGGVSAGAFLLVAYSVPPRQRSILVGMIGGMCKYP